MKKAFLSFAAGTAMMLFAGTTAMAQTYPTNITGTWTIRANDTTPFTLTISAQSSDAPCAQISGSMGAPSDPIVGYYCPAIGAVSFLRNSASTGATYQVFTGELSWLGNPTYMTGTFSNFAGGVDSGSFGFMAYTSAP